MLEISVHNTNVLLDKIEVVKLEIEYHILVKSVHCSWIVKKQRNEFLELLQRVYSTEKHSIISNEIFPKFLFSSSPEKIQSHQHRVQGLLDSLPFCENVNKFLEFDKHDVLTVTINFLKDIRLNFGGNADIWDILNKCDEDLVLTEKQLHCLNSCPIPVNYEVPLLELKNTLEKVEHLKIVGSEADHDHKYHTSPNLDMSVFNSLVTLYMKNIDFTGVTEFGGLSETLQKLTIKGSIKEISEALIWVSESITVSWSYIQDLDLSSNSIEKMDESMRMLINLQNLNLSFNKILTIDNIRGLPYLDNINLSHNRIIDVASLNTKLGNVSTLNLSHNYIKNLAGLEKMYSLEKLDISYNYIDDMSQIKKLSDLPNLRNLDLSNNILQRKRKYRYKTALYRFHVLVCFTELTPEFILDQTPASNKEIQKVLLSKSKTTTLDAITEDEACIIDIGKLDADSVSMVSDWSYSDDGVNITVSDVNLVDTPSFIQPNRKNQAHILDCDEKAPTTVDEIKNEIEHFKINFNQNDEDWISRFVSSTPTSKPTKMPHLVPVTRDHLKTLDKKHHWNRIKNIKEYVSSTSDSSETNSKVSLETNYKSCSKETKLSKHNSNEASDFRDNVKAQLDNFANKALNDIQKNFSVYINDIFHVVGVDFENDPSNPTLLELHEGSIQWTLRSDDLESFELVGDHIIKLKKYQDDSPRLYKQYFLQDVAQLYTLLQKMKEVAEKRKGVEEAQEALGRVPSDLLFLKSHSQFDTVPIFSFPSHCILYKNVEQALPVIIALVNTKLYVAEIKECELLSINQDTIRGLISKKQSFVQISVILEDDVSNIAQILKSYFLHTVRIELRNNYRPVGSPETTFTLLGFNLTDIEAFLDKIKCSASDIVTQEQQTDMLKLHRVLSTRDLDHVKCIPVRQIRESFRFRSFVMTENDLYILDEDVVKWPPPRFICHTPITSRYNILHRTPIRFVFGVTFYELPYLGGFMLLLDFYENFKSMKQKQWYLLTSSFEVREQIIGHIQRTWQQWWNRNIIITKLYIYRAENSINRCDDKSVAVRTDDKKTWCFQNISNSSPEVVQKFVEMELHDHFTVTYILNTTCLTQTNPTLEYNCTVILTTEMFHLIVPQVPGKTESAPRLLFSTKIMNLVQIMAGIFEQKVRLEFCSVEANELVSLLTCNVNKTKDVRENIKAVLGCQYLSDSYDVENVMITKAGRELSIVCPDDNMLDDLRYSIAEYCHIRDYNDIQVLQYYICYETHQAAHTNSGIVTFAILLDGICIIDEDHVRWPLPLSKEYKSPPTEQYHVIRHVNFRDIVCLEYTTPTSRDFTILYENVSVGGKLGGEDDQYCVLNRVEKMGETLSLIAATYQQRDNILRVIRELKDDNIPVIRSGGGTLSGIKAV